MDPIKSSIFSNYDNINYTDINNSIKASEDEKVEIKNLSRIMHSNSIFDSRDKKWVKAYNRYGWINFSEFEQPCREYLFFTRPDLYLFNGSNYDDAKLSEDLEKIPYFVNAANNHKDALIELQYRISNMNNDKDPFMHLLTNHVISKLDLPAISSESNRSTPNIYGLSIDYRAHSLKTDHAFDFAITFKDNNRLDIYTIVKTYDEYMRKLKIGEITFGIGQNGINNVNVYNHPMEKAYYKSYIINHTIPEQFSIYKFIVGSDGETIIYYAKLTGVYFTDVPRAEFGDPPQDGFKYSVSFHANIIEDMDPMILAEFDSLTLASEDVVDFLPVFSNDINAVNNEPARYARVVYVRNDERSKRHGYSLNYGEYRLKWTNVRKKEYKRTNFFFSQEPIQSTIGRTQANSI